MHRLDEYNRKSDVMVYYRKTKVSDQILFYQDLSYHSNAMTSTYNYTIANNLYMDSFEFGQFAIDKRRWKIAKQDVLIGLFPLAHCLPLQDLTMLARQT